MKSVILVLWILFPLLSRATPDRSITTSEVFIGSNGDEYAVLRIESDNLGSYYNAHRKTWLDICQKSWKPESKSGSTLLLDETRHVSVEDGSPTPATQHFKDDKFTLADLADRFSITTLSPWSPEWRKDLLFDEKTGRTMFKSQCLVEGRAALGSRFGTSSEGLDLQLLDVAEDGDCIYLTIRMGMDEGQETRIICIPSDVSRNVHALMDLEPIYLSAGSFKSREEAFAMLRTLWSDQEPYSRWEVWSVWHEETKGTEFEVVLADSKSQINDMRLMINATRYSVHLLPVTSEGFRVRLPIPPPETPSR